MSSFGFSWMGWGAGPRTLYKTAELLRIEGRGFTSLPQTECSSEASMGFTSLFLAALQGTQNTVGVQKMFAKPQAKPGPRAPSMAPTAVNLSKQHPALNTEDVIYRIRAYIGVISECGSSVNLC